ncbi:MAG: DUF3168 domain-containing protein [Bauldia sp.]
MEELLVQLLLGAPGLTALVETRVKWALLPQGALRPNVALHLVAGERHYTAGRPDGLKASMVQIDAWANNFTGALQVAREVEAQLSGYRDAPAGSGFDGIFLRAIRSDVDKTGAEILHRVSQDFEIWTTA